MIERDKVLGRLSSNTIKGITRAAKLARECFVDRETRPDSSDCRNVTDNMVEYGKDQFVFLEKLPKEESAFAMAEHCCTRLVKDGQAFAVDGQYLQFVPQGERGNFPEVMIVSVDNKRVLVEGLHQHHISDSKHHLWVNLFFSS